MQLNTLVEKELSYRFYKNKHTILNERIPTTKIYRKYRPTHTFLKKHPLCKGHSYVFLKIKNLSNFEHEYKINILLYNKLKGRNISKCLGFSKNYIVYEYIEHRTLDQILYDYTKKSCSPLKLKKESHNLSKYINILKSAKGVIQQIHSYGYTINDVHLNNILITKDYSFYLTDFEEAKKTFNYSLRRGDFKVINDTLFLLYIYRAFLAVRSTVIYFLRPLLPNRFLRDDSAYQH